MAIKEMAAVNADAVTELKRINLDISAQSFISCLLQQDDSLAHLMIEAGLDPNTPYGESTIFLAAATEGNRNIVEALINAGADVNACDSKGTTPLMIAASAGWSGTVSALLKTKDVNINATDNSGLSALDWAKRSKQEWKAHKMSTKGHTAVVTLLKKAGAK